MTGFAKAGDGESGAEMGGSSVLFEHLPVAQ